MPTAKDILFGLASLLTLGHFITSSIIAADAINHRDQWKIQVHGYQRRAALGAALGAATGPVHTDKDIAAQLPIFHSGLFRALVNGVAWLYFILHLTIRKTAPASRLLALGGDFVWLIVWTILIVVAQAWHWPHPTPKAGVELADIILWAVQLASYALIFLWLLGVLAKGVCQFGFVRALGKSEHTILHPEEEQEKLFHGSA